MPRLSVILIARNEAKRLPAALASVGFADEIVVVDGGSDDATAEIARRAGATVSVRPDWQGFGVQKNRALALATGDWVLSLDCDERISPESRDEILAAIAQPSAAGYRLPRLSSMCGRPMLHAGWWPDHVLRLARRDQARFTDDVVHERMEVNGPVGTLTQPILHEGYATLEDALQKMNRYSTDGARRMRREGRGAAGPVASAFQAAARGTWMFLRTYLFKAGFLDGREGFYVAVVNAENTFWRYAKRGYPDPAEDAAGARATTAPTATTAAATTAGPHADPHRPPTPAPSERERTHESGSHPTT